MKISAVIISYNEAQNIGRCIGALHTWVDEIIVLDSFSTDATVAIAQQYGAKVVQEIFQGFAAQKNRAAALAQHDWVLSIDADEQISEALKTSIIEVCQQPQYDAYFLKRTTQFYGKFIKHGSWYPDKQCRLWNKTKGQWTGEIHEKWRLFDAQQKYGLLNGDLLHYSFDTIDAYMAMANRYTSMSAQEAFKKGKKVSFLKMVLGPVFKFIQDYIFKLGFLEGYAGWLAYRLAAQMAFLKYSKIRELYKNNKN